MNIIDFNKPVKRSFRGNTAPAPQLEKVLTVILKTDVPVLMGICSDGLRSNSAILGGEFQAEYFSVRCFPVVAMCLSSCRPSLPFWKPASP